MRKLSFALIAAGILLSTLPAAPVAEAAPYRFSSAFTDGWPKWIGRTGRVVYTKHICRDGMPCRTLKMRPDMASKYLPLSLIKTGTFRSLVGEVADTPNVDTTGWPTWIGEITQ